MKFRLFAIGVSLVGGAGALGALAVGLGQAESMVSTATLSLPDLPTIALLIGTPLSLRFAKSIAASIGR